MRNERLYPRWHHPRYYGLVNLRKALEKIVAEHPFENKVLVDYGCGSMPYRPLFEKKVARYIGADIEENKEADIPIDTVNGRMSIPAEFVDVVLSTQVLEHVESPSLYLQEAHRICKPDGMLVLSTHGFWLYHPSPGDYWRWTASGLKKQLRDNGWQTECTTGIFGFAAAALCLWQDAISLKLPPFFRTPFCVVMQQIINLVDHFYTPAGRAENATLYVVVARKVQMPEEKAVRGG